MDDVVDQLPELWETCLRVRDDIKVFENSHKYKLLVLYIVHVYLSHQIGHMNSLL